MDTTGVISVLDADGAHLVMEDASRAAAGSEGQVELSLEDGQRVLVPAGLLQKRSDGTYYLPLRTRELRGGAPPTEGERQAEEGALVVPVVEERLDVHKRTTSARVRIHKTVEQYEAVVDDPTLHEDVEVKRVPIGREVDGPVPVRHEGDVLIVPLLEEVLVVEKRLIVREELRITRRRTRVRDPHRETLRFEQVAIERLPVDRAQQAEDEPGE